MEGPTYYKRCPERIVIVALRKMIKKEGIPDKMRMEAIRIYSTVTGLIPNRKTKKKTRDILGVPVSQDRLQALLSHVEETKQ